MANKEISRQIAERRGKIALGINSPTDNSVFTEPLTPEENNILKKRWTPRVRAVMVKAGNALKASITTNNPGRAYEAATDYCLASIYGERGVDAVEWGQPPLIGAPEQRYLIVINNLAKYIYTGRYSEAGQLMQGITATYGSNGDSGGFPCNPEILSSVMTIEGYLQSIFQSKPLGEDDGKWGKKIGEQIHCIARGYMDQNRTAVWESLQKLDRVTNSYFKQKRVERRLSSIHPNLGGIAHKVDAHTY